MSNSSVCPTTGLDQDGNPVPSGAEMQKMGLKCSVQSIVRKKNYAHISVMKCLYFRICR